MFLTKKRQIFLEHPVHIYSVYTLQRPGKMLFLRTQYRAVLVPALHNWARLVRDG
jgi:hypothetical protein